MNDRKKSCEQMRAWLTACIRGRQSIAMAVGQRLKWAAEPVGTTPSGIPLPVLHTPLPGRLFNGSPEADPVPVARFGSFDCAFHAAVNDPWDTVARCTFELDFLERHAPWPEGLVNQLCSVGDDIAWPCPDVRGLIRAYRHKPGWNPDWDELVKEEP